MDYFGLHFCTMARWEGLSVALLIGVVLVTFYLLGETAEEYFCPVVRRQRQRPPKGRDESHLRTSRTAHPGATRTSPIAIARAKVRLV